MLPIEFFSLLISYSSILMAIFSMQLLLISEIASPNSGITRLVLRVKKIRRLALTMGIISLSIMMVEIYFGFPLYL